MVYKLINHALVEHEKPLSRCQKVQVSYKRLIQDENKTDKWAFNN